MAIRNTRPITSKRQALELLKSGFGDNTLRYVRLRSCDHRRVVVIVIEVYSGYRDELSHTNEYLVGRDLFDWLRTEQLIIGAPHWGGRSKLEFVPTEKIWSAADEPASSDEEELPDFWSHR